MTVTLRELSVTIPKSNTLSILTISYDLNNNRALIEGFDKIMFVFEENF